MKIELNLSNNATKANLKGASSIDISTQASKTYLGGSKTKVYRLGKLKAAAADLSQLSNAVHNDVFKRYVY